MHVPLLSATVFWEKPLSSLMLEAFFYDPISLLKAVAIIVPINAGNGPLLAILRTLTAGQQNHRQRNNRRFSESMTFRAFVNYFISIPSQIIASMDWQVDLTVYLTGTHGSQSVPPTRNPARLLTELDLKLGSGCSGTCTQSFSRLNRFEKHKR